MLLQEHREPLGTKECKHCVNLGRTAALNEVREIADGLLYNTEDGKELDPIQELKDRLTNLEKGK